MFPVDAAKGCEKDSKNCFWYLVFMDDDKEVRAPALTAWDDVDDWAILKELGKEAERYC
jgi:hypothetical protein